MKRQLHGGGKYAQRWYHWQERRASLPTPRYLASASGGRARGGGQVLPGPSAGVNGPGWRTMNDRYTINDPHCWLVASAQNNNEAQRLAQRHEERSDCGGRVVFYGRMAHRGRPRKWLPNGNILRWRPLQGSSERGRMTQLLDFNPAWGRKPTAKAGRADFTFKVRLSKDGGYYRIRLLERTIR